MSTSTTGNNKSFGTVTVSQSRPDIELALDIRSHEHIVVLSNPDSVYDYPEKWDRPINITALNVHEDTVVLVDRIELSQRTLEIIALGNPRLVAFAMISIDHEKQVRRMITATYPHAEVWTISTSFGKILVSKDIKGLAYTRSNVVDLRDAEQV